MIFETVLKYQYLRCFRASQKTQKNTYDLFQFASHLKESIVYYRVLLAVLKRHYLRCLRAQINKYQGFVYVSVLAWRALSRSSILGQNTPQFDESIVYYRVLFPSIKHRYLRWFTALQKITVKHVCLRSSGEPV